MQPLRALIGDDEAPARRKLMRMLAAAGGVEVVAEAADGPAALAALGAAQPQIAFLDIDMPGLSGLAVAREAPKGTQIVFVTAHGEHALQAFELHACDYLLKPYDAVRLQDVLEHAREHLTVTPARLEVDLGNRKVFVEVETLEWAQAARNYVELHTGNTTLLTRTTLESLAAKLGGAGFVRINRSVLVRTGAVRETRACGHGECRVKLADGSEHIWTRRYRRSLAEPGLRPDASRPTPRPAHPKSASRMAGMPYE